MQRLFYFSSVGHFFEGGIKTVYYLFPAFFFLFGTVPVYPYPPIIVGMLLYFGITRLILELITGGRSNLVLDEVYSVVKSFIYLSALPALFFNKNVRFRVTPKNKGKPVSFQGVAGSVIIFGFNLAAIIVAFFNLFRMDLFGWIIFGWCFYTGSIALTACYYCFKPLIKNK